jgi:hypothetical protein
MSKLLTEPRITKQVGPKKTTKRIKKKAEDSPKAKFTIINEGENTKVTKLFKLYKEDPYKARVKYFNSPAGHVQHRTVLFEYDQNNFEICKFENSFGISVTNRIYSRQKKMEAIVYKDGKFWHLTRGMNGMNVKPLIFAFLISFSKYDDTSFIFKFLEERFPWLRTIKETQLAHGLALNTIKEHKLFGANDLNRYIMKVPNNIAKMVLASNLFTTIGNRTSLSSKKVWADMLRYIDNIQNLKPQMVGHSYFYDTVQMAKTLGRKVNCNWGEKKLKAMHNAWSLEIANTVLDCENEYELNIKNIYKAFADYSGFTLLRTNKDMLREGIVQKHCVGTYISQVEGGNTALYHVDGYTLQLKVSDIHWSIIDAELIISKEKGDDISRMSIYSNGNNDFYNVGVIKYLDREHTKCLTNVQFKGKYNEEAPKELIDKVDKMLIGFVNDGGFYKVIDSNFKTEDILI